MRGHITQLATISLCIVFTLACSHCSKNVKDTSAEDKPDEATKTLTDTGSLDEKFLKEGFINNNYFRVVILTPKDDSSDINELESKAKKRAYVSLQKFLMSAGRQVDKNTRAELLNMINSKGSFSKKDIKQCKDSVYYYEIKRSNLKKHLKKISQR